MEGCFAFAAFGVALAFFSGFLITQWVAARRRLAPLAVDDTYSGGLPPAAAHILRNGISAGKPVARGLLRWAAFDFFMHQAVQFAEERGVFTSLEAIASVFVAGNVAVLALVSLVAGTPVGGMAAVGCVCVVSAAMLNAANERRVARMRESVPDALRCMEVCFQSGLSLPQVLEQVAQETQQGVGALFRKAANRLRLGHSSAEALEVLRRGGIDELAFAAVALDVQHEAGGSITHALEAAREAVESRLELQRSLRVQTAQAKLSARIVSVLPFALIALFSLISEDFLAPFFESFVGMALLTAALGMQAAGVFAVRRTLRVEVG